VTDHEKGWSFALSKPGRELDVDLGAVFEHANRPPRRIALDAIAELELLDVDEQLPGVEVDLVGEAGIAAGIGGRQVVDHDGGAVGQDDALPDHKSALLKGVALATVMGVGSELAFGSSDSDLIKALQQSTQSTTNRAGQRLVERNLNVQPTITVRPGWPLRVLVQKDIVLRAYRGMASK
jgi:hypothetical protein